MNDHADPTPGERRLDTLSAVGLVLFVLGITLSYWLLLQSVGSIAAIDGNVPPKGYTFLLQ